VSRRRGILGQPPRDECVPNGAARERLLSDVAELYYVQRLSQKAIAARIGRSVPTVSRLLADAEARDIVDVRVRYPVPVVPELQRELVNRFGLRLARVADVRHDRPCNPLGQVAELAARHLATVLHDGAIVSVAWGSSISEAVRLLKTNPHRNVHVVQALGSLGSRLPTIDNPVITQTLAQRVDGTPHYLPAPMIVDSKSSRDAFASDPQLAETLALGGKPDIALVGIGMADPGLSGICRAGYLDPWDMERIRASGAVGDVVVEFYDLFGRVRDTDVGDRVVGMRLPDLANTRTVVAIARGAAKAAAILGALRTGLIHVLVTDNITACRVLELADTYPESRSFALDVTRASVYDAASDADAEQRQTEAILAATIATLQDHGYGELTVAAVAARAGVAVRSICERWPSKAALVMEAYIAAAEERVAHPDSGNVRADLQAILSLIGESADADPTHVPAWRRSLAIAIERGKRRGELSAEADTRLLVDMILGAVWYRTQVERTPADAAFTRGIVTTIADGNKPRDPDATERATAGPRGAPDAWRPLRSVAEEFIRAAR
jgi:deoxyribonucleoside regulator